MPQSSRKKLRNSSTKQKNGANTPTRLAIGSTLTKGNKYTVLWKDIKTFSLLTSKTSSPSRSSFTMTLTQVTLLLSNKHLTGHLLPTCYGSVKKSNEWKMPG